MKLIDIETGEEYCSNEIPEQFNKYCAPYMWCQKTGKVYEKRYGTCWLNRPYFAVTSVRNQEDTHGFICFGEPLEKVEPMPEILAGDYLVGESCNIYVFENDNLNKLRVGLVSIYRNGKLIWERKL